MHRYLQAPLGVAAAAFLVGCSAGAGSESAATGTLKVALTDAPACGYDNVWVTVTKVRVHQSQSAADNDGDWAEMLVDPSTGGRRIDLLTLQNGVLGELGRMALPAGRYSQVRLVLASNAEVARANEIVLTSSREIIPLDTPSAQQSGLKLKHAFEVAANSEADLVLDFDACRSIVKAGNSGKYNLKPVIAAIPILTGSIAGAVDPEAARNNASVSLQRSDGATGTVTVVRATTVRADGSWLLAPVPATAGSPTGYNLVIGSRGYADVIYTNVPVVTAATTTIPTVALLLTTPRTISGTVLPVLPDDPAQVQALQRVVDEAGLASDVVIQTAFVNADAILGSYELTVPEGVARVATFGQALANGANAGQFVIAATAGSATRTAPASVIGGNAMVNVGP